MRCEKGDHQAAEPLFRESIEIIGKSLGADHWMVAAARSNYGHCLRRLERYEEAEKILLAAYPVLQGQFGEQHERTQKAVSHLVALYVAWGKPEKAVDYRVLLDEAEQQESQPQ